MEAVVHTGTCELVNTYEILEHVMGISGLHPHSLTTIDMLHKKLADHTVGKEGVVVDMAVVVRMAHISSRVYCRMVCLLSGSM